MKDHQEFKKDWEKTKTQILKLSKEAAKMAQKGEKELMRFSKRGKLHLDSTAASLKKEQLYYQIGKEYVALKDPAVASDKLTKLVSEVTKLNKEQGRIKGKLKVKK